MTKIKILFFWIFVSTILCCCTKQKRKVKTEKVYEYYYKMGELSKIGRLDSETKYNANGKEEEELEYGFNDSISIKTIYRYNNDGKLTEEAKFSGGILYKKKLVSYNESGQKDLIEFYQEEDGNLIRGAWLKIFYNKDNKVAIKKWLGRIDHTEKYSWFSRTYIADKPIDQMPDISKQDTTIAKYFYNPNGKVDKIEISRYQLSIYQQIFQIPDKKILDIYETIKYSYNNNDSLILIDEVSKNILEKMNGGRKTEFFYKNGMLAETKENDARKIFDKNKNVIEEIIYGTDNLQWKRFTYKYNDENNLIEVTEYNNANEPDRQYKTIYEYQ